MKKLEKLLMLALFAGTVHVHADDSQISREERSGGQSRGEENRGSRQGSRSSGEGYNPGVTRQSQGGYVDYGHSYSQQDRAAAGAAYMGREGANAGYYDANQNYIPYDATQPQQQQPPNSQPQQTYPYYQQPY